jgi:hypothetical protein
MKLLSEDNKKWQRESQIEGKLIDLWEEYKRKHNLVFESGNLTLLVREAMQTDTEFRDKIMGERMLYQEGKSTI